jgi:acyl carrier protein
MAALPGRRAGRGQRMRRETEGTWHRGCAKCLPRVATQRMTWWFMTKNAAAVIEIIAREAKCSTGEITLNTSLDVLGIDSLKAIVILSELEDLLGIEIPNEILGSINTVGDIVAKIDELRDNNKPE